MKKFFLSMSTAVLLVLIGQTSFAATTEVDSLLKIMTKKGLITEEEAEQVKGEIAYDEKTIREENNKKDIPEWVQNMKLKGDFRIRHEYSKRNDSTDIERNRGRIRYRLGVETKINDKVNVGVGLASNGGNPRSTNQTFTDTFSKSQINLDYAYAEYIMNDTVKITGGKMKIPFWEPSDLLWDTDLTPEGGALNLTYKISEAVNLFSAVDAFVLDEISTDVSDPFMYVVQESGGNLTEKTDYKLAATFFGFDNGKKQLLDSRSSPTTNTVNGGRYDFNYNVIEAGLELGLNDPLGEDFPLYIPRVGLISQYVHNPSPEELNNGWLFGGYLGNSKVGGTGQWKITGTYRSLGRDAWLDALPDSDFYGGATDVKGYETILEYGLAKNVVLSLDYYRAERIKTDKAVESVFQADMNFKF